MTNSTTTKIVAATILSLAMGTALVGCNDASDPSTDDSHAHDHDGHDSDHGHDHAHDSDASTAQATPDVYPDILGQIMSLPIEGDPSTELKIHHEQIPDFKAKDGVVHVNAAGISGMQSMVMPFPLSTDTNTDGLAIGDKVKFTFQVNWGSASGPAWEITKIEKIDPTTEINFNNFIDDAMDAAEDAVDDAMDSMDDMMNHDGP